MCILNKLHWYCCILQLTVLATYTGDALSAIYHYCRSLAVDAPFITARENIILLLEKVGMKSLVVTVIMFLYATTMYMNKVYDI